MSYSGMPVFFTAAERTLLVDAGRELVEYLTYQYFDLYRIDNVRTDSNFYGENKVKHFKEKLTLTGRIKISDSDVTLQGGFRRVSQGDMILGIYTDLLEENNCDINVGDIIHHHGKYYEVFDAGYNKDSNERKLGVDREFYRTILANTVKEDIVEGNLNV
jgi:hypothetical protein